LAEEYIGVIKKLKNGLRDESCNLLPSIIKGTG
jgi:hypothetical protein